jgi:phage baseplate assembly protein gpV
MELLADSLMKFIAGSGMLLKSGTHVTVQAPKVTIDSPDTTCTGNLLIKGKLTYQGGMAGSGGSGAAAAISGNVEVDGNVNASGSIMDAGGNSNHHSH